MANYNLVVGSKFQPFSFERYLKPYQIYGEVYSEVENALSELATKANIWEGLINEQTEKAVYDQYKGYADDLEAQVDALNREGLSLLRRKGLMDMRKRYSSEILPIEQAYKSRAEEAQAQYEGRSKGLVYEGDAATSSLNRYLNNPSIRYNYADSQEGFNRVAAVASALSRGFRNYDKGKRLDDFTKAWFENHGYTDKNIASAISDVRKIMNGDTNVQSNGVLRSILEDEMHTAGIDTWSNQEAINDYFNRVAPALYKAVGQTEIHPYEDYAARHPEFVGGGTPPTSALFPTSTTRMPVSPARAKSSSVKDIVSRFIRVGEDGRLYTKNFYVSGDMYGFGEGMTKTNSVNTNLFVSSQGHRLKTRAEFISAGKTKEEKEDLGRYYEYNVQPLLNEMNNGSSKGITARDFQRYSEANGDKVLNENSTYIDVIDFPLGGTPEKIEKGMSNLLNQTIWEISPSKDGTSWEKKRKAGSLQDIINEVKKNKGAFNTGFAVQKNNRGFVLTTKDKAYIMPLSQINSSTSKGLEQLLDLWSSTVNETDASNYRQAFTSGLGVLANGTYNTNEFDITNQPTVK